MAEENIKFEDEKYVPEHEYDGIRELDNPPPPWIMWVLYISIFWAALYLAHYHWFGQGDLQDAEYQKEIKQAELAMAEKNKTQGSGTMSETELISLGEKVFTGNGCAGCHGSKGEGNSVGPNLTDNYWLHGGTKDAVVKSIKFGIPNKGMPAFKGQLSEEKIDALATYIVKKLVGSNPPNAKDPQGTEE